MYVHTARCAIDNGRPDRSFTDGLELAERIEVSVAIPITLWSAPFASTGTELVWSARIQNLVQMDLLQAALYSDYRENDRFRPAVQFPAPRVEALLEIISGVPVGPPAPFVTARIAYAAGDDASDAIAWGTNLAEEQRRTLKSPVMFGINVFGDDGRLAWVVSHPDAHTVETAGRMLKADPTIKALMDEGRHLLQPRRRQHYLRRLN
ncbi:MAG: hypothetical protein HKN03_04400 [Acidimicrobiales bacterium]|nr:hypothetical protein [Acidimicrobiales bacterium]